MASTFPRRSGIVFHPTSLAGPVGIGDLGDAAYQFVDFLASAGQSYWQVLPMSPTGYGDSPYQGLSVFAGNPMLISPQRLAAAGHLSRADLNDAPPFPTGSVDFGWVIPYKTSLLERAFDRFRSQAAAAQQAAFSRFCADQAFWLDDVALFMALKEHYELRPWHEWDAGIARRTPAALEHWRAMLGQRVESHKYRQWQFYEQWLALKRYANGKGIRVIGDMPIYVARDSADVWANPSLWHCDEQLNPTVVSGVPPDYFSATGQLWGHPIYRWDDMARDSYRWWIARFRMAFTQTDIVRIDHFRGFYNYWEVPANETTAVNGVWRPGPGAGIFHALTQALSNVQIIAEDLGDFDAESRAGLDTLQSEFGFPGMRVLQFSFGASPDNLFLPHNFTHDCVVYTGTHDNDTTVGWYRSAADAEKDFTRRYLGRDGADIAWDLIRLAWSSLADTALTTVQDLLSLGSEARMNRPGSSGAPNWCWRLTPGALDAALAARLRDLTFVYGRTAERPPDR